MWMTRVSVDNPILATMVMAAMPPWLSAMPTAMGVVQLLGSSAAVTASSSRNRRHSSSTLARLNRLPAVWMR